MTAALVIIIMYTDCTKYMYLRIPIMSTQWYKVYHMPCQSCQVTGCCNYVHKCHFLFQTSSHTDTIWMSLAKAWKSQNIQVSSIVPHLFSSISNVVKFKILFSWKCASPEGNTPLRMHGSVSVPASNVQGKCQKKFKFYSETFLWLTTMQITTSCLL
jgi:hypothetical protein